MPAVQGPSGGGQPAYLCGEDQNREVPVALHGAVLASPSCLRAAGLAFCIVGNYQVDFNLFASIKAGDCVQVGLWTDHQTR